MSTASERALSCGEVLARLDAFADGSLPADERRAVELHVARCPNCERFGGHYAAIIARLRGAPTPAAPDALLRAILAR